MKIGDLSRSLVKQNVKSSGMFLNEVCMKSEKSSKRGSFGPIMG